MCQGLDDWQVQWSNPLFLASMTDYAPWNQRHKILDDEQHQSTQFLFKYVQKSHFSPSVSSMCGIIMTPCQSSFPESNIILSDLFLLDFFNALMNVSHPSQATSQQLTCFIGDPSSIVTSKKTSILNGEFLYYPAW